MGLGDETGTVIINLAERISIVYLFVACKVVLDSTTLVIIYLTFFECSLACSLLNLSCFILCIRKYMRVNCKALCRTQWV